MNIKWNTRGDDRKHVRLLSYLSSCLPFEIDEFVQLRTHVYFVRTRDFSIILKGFPNLFRLGLQDRFTSSLKKAGFNDTYRFLSFTDDLPLLFDGKYYGFMEYIAPHPSPFTYEAEKDRVTGLELLTDFHTKTRELVDEFENELPVFGLIEKWNQRKDTFLSNVRVIKYFIQTDLIETLVEWADLSLEGIEREKRFFQSEPPVVLHGDVAHHNFLRAENGKVYLIDFDLISIGPPSMDFLQYANRILPFLDWSIKKLSAYRQFKEYLKHDAFLYALMFPADIFREWNRIVREQSYENSAKMYSLLKMTAGQFHLRRQFIQTLNSMVK